jgi:hypothetical protein
VRERERERVVERKGEGQRNNRYNMVADYDDEEKGAKE